MKPKPWDRKLWGVQCGTMLIGSLWAKRPAIKDEPTRPLLFCSRTKCRQWIASQADGYWGRQARRGHRLRAVRVRECVEVIE